MFDIGAVELLVIVIVAILVIGPSEMPRAMRTAGRWIGQVRKVSAHFRTGIDTMVREAELEDMEKKWKAQNESIMKRSAEKAEHEVGEPVMTGPPPIADDGGSDPMADDPPPSAPAPAAAPSDDNTAPELPLDPAKSPKD
ncbi:Sec-independent protein translocase protein TatB [Erythrobacter crassostreae]|uniref:Sec-independent protein translocase protein TatB n=1 Tax=Erythrobacter crassostreae TaxID=2828328 RepID=A0A9X1F2V1_9SPHN|nr:Sec-independent protein translocase protein TatB [Erythrobacter crassostrea]MBV7259272.1 twin-arginine translocase subunit TatB [Erythrobacter crassostrea]